HDDVGHRGYYATRALISERFWWPHLSQDVKWFVSSCHLCQLRQTRNVRIPPVVATPAPLFAKIYVDTMHLPKAGGYKYIVQGRDSLTHYPDAFVAALEYLQKRYHFAHIRISGYNSRANGIAERSHFDVRQALFKAVDGDQSKWHTATHTVFWSDRITIRRRMGCSPYFAVTGTHPVIPLDIVEATYLQPPPDSILSTEDLIARRAIALQKRRSQLAALHSKVFEARRTAALRFERDHPSIIKDFAFPKGALVLMRNTAIEKSLNRKMRARYLGPYVVLSRNRGGAYILAELDGATFDRPVAAFRLV
ncbi:hypothetical protein BV25DRAFT_1783852, partial [Artomyces pyxidatus]